MCRTWVLLALVATVGVGWGQERVLPLPQYAAPTIRQKPMYKAAIDTLSLPFMDDFCNPTYSAKQWTWQGILFNPGLARRAPTWGVLNMDGLNERGLPHNATPGTWGRADVATTAPIDLSAYSPADSVMISFWVQAGGWGDLPARQDSLVLQARTRQGVWKTLWAAAGTKDTTFQWVIVPITDTALFYKGVQFRFYNNATLSGLNDVWNIDWVFIDANRSVADTILLDVGVQYGRKIFASPYTRLPWRQFQAMGALNNPQIGIANLSNQTRNVQYRFRLLNPVTGDVLDSSTYVATNLASGVDTFDMTWGQFPSNVAFGDTALTLEMQYIIQPASGNTFVHNDTLRLGLHFDGVLAYDDGLPERAYGVEGTSSAFAYQYTLPQPDTLWAVAIAFVNHNADQMGRLFSVAVWQELRPESLIVRKDFLEPCLTDTARPFCVYLLDSPIVVQGTFYVGWIQYEWPPLLVGLDRNYDARQYAWFRTGHMWQPSRVRGAIMIRPVIGNRKEVKQWIQQAVVSSTQDILGTEGHLQVRRLGPASVYIRAPASGTWQLMDHTGRLIQLMHGRSEVLLRLTPGIYVVQWHDSNRQLMTRILIP